MSDSIHGEKMRKKTMGGLVCSIIMNAVFAGIYGWFAFPHGNLDNWRLWAERTAERDLFVDQTAFNAAYPTEKDKMEFWGEGFCFYTPTEEDGLENMVPEFVYNPDNSNQRCVSCEFAMGIFIWFILSIINIVFLMVSLCAYGMKSKKCFNFANSIMSCGNCVGFVTFIMLSCSRWSEAGRACSGEYMMEPEQATAVQTPDSLISIDFNAVYTSCMDPATGCLLNGEIIATTIETGFFLQIILVIAWVMIGVSCCCCCCMMCCMRRMMKNKMAESNADAARGEKVLNTDMSSSANVTNTNA
jgi:hypothetical protein